MHPLRIALGALAISAASAGAGALLGPWLGGWAAVVAVSLGFGGAAVLAVLCWRSCHVSVQSTTLEA